MIEQFKEQRRRFIFQAINDAKKWCIPPDSRVENKRYSDQYWLKLFFTAAETVTHSNVHDFLVAFQLVRARNWDKQAVAERIVAFSNYEDSDITAAVNVLAQDLSGYITPYRGLQTSAASKIAFFANPHREVFIWDRLVNQSSRFRDWVRAGGRDNPGRFNRLRTVGKVHDYTSYCASCAAALTEERSRSDFREAIKEFENYLQRVGGPMADTKAVRESSFIERRFLDKLMFWEGDYLEKLTATS